jgi:PAS domain S-box-containing protein
MSKLKSKIYSMSIRSKFVLLNSLISILIVIVLSIILPSKIERSVLNGSIEKAKSITAITSSSLKPSLYFGDKEDGRSVLNNARQSKDIVYIVVENNKGSIFVSYNLEEAIHLGYSIPGQFRYSHELRLLFVKQQIKENEKILGTIYLGFSLESVHNEIENVQTRILLISGIVFLIGFISLYSISTFLMNPLTRMIKTIEKISAGDRNLRADIVIQKEVAQLGRAFNRMLDNLNDAYLKIQIANEDLEKRILERTKELSKSNATLRNEIIERKKAESITEVLFKIAKVQNSAQKLDELFDVIHLSIGSVLYNKNFYIALYDKETDAITFPFFLDEFDLAEPIFHASESVSLTAEVIFQGKSLLFNSEQLKVKREKDQQKVIGTFAKVWMGIPLKIKEKTIGAMVLQSYENENQFTADDIEIAESFAEQIAIAINNKETEERINLLASAVENTNEAVSITDNENNLLYVNKAFYNLYCFSPSELIGKNIDIIRTSKFSKEDYRQIASSTIEGGWHGELMNRRKDGSEFPIYLSTSPVLDENGNSIALIGVATDITELKNAREKIQESERNFKYLFEYNPLPMHVFDISTLEFIEVNDAMVKHYGYTKEEFSKMGLSDILIDETTMEDLAPMQNTNVGNNYRGIRKHRLKSGEVIDVEINANALNYFGRVAILGVAIDISDKLKAERSIKASLKEKDTLLQEIHHRVKNNMQIISSLLNLQAIDIKEKEYLDLFNESQDRVKSMAMIHELLYVSNDLSKIDFYDYLKRLTSSLIRSYSSKKKIDIKIEAKNIYLSMDTAIPCGLVINELVTNALKYAFRESDSGIISIIIEQKDKLLIIVEDNGIGLPEGFNLTDSKKLGLRLVKLLVNQLKGEVNYFRNDKTKFIITI